MWKDREVLGLKYACAASERAISHSVGIGPTTIGKYIRRAAVIGITRPVAEELETRALERKLLAPAGPRSESPPGVWAYPRRAASQRCDAGAGAGGIWPRSSDCYGYSRFCDLYVEWRHGITATMRQTHPAGEKLFVDFAGDTVPVFDGLTEEVRAQDLRRGPGGIELHLRPSPARHCPTGSALLSMRSPSRMGCRRRSSATISRPGMVASRYERGVNRT
jgi:hypothetical protein